MPSARGRLQRIWKNGALVWRHHSTAQRSRSARRKCARRSRWAASERLPRSATWWRIWHRTHPSILPARPSISTAASVWNFKTYRLLGGYIMDNIIGGKLVADALIARGVDYVFSL